MINYGSIPFTIFVHVSFRHVYNYCTSVHSTASQNIPIVQGQPTTRSSNRNARNSGANNTGNSGAQFVGFELYKRLSHFLKEYLNKLLAVCIFELISSVWAVYEYFHCRKESVYLTKTFYGFLLSTGMITSFPAVFWTAFAPILIVTGWNESVMKDAKKFTKFIRYVFVVFNYVFYYNKILSLKIVGSGFLAWSSFLFFKSARDKRCLEANWKGAKRRNYQY